MKGRRFPKFMIDKLPQWLMVLHPPHNLSCKDRHAPSCGVAIRTDTRIQSLPSGLAGRLPHNYEGWSHSEPTIGTVFNVKISVFPEFHFFFCSNFATFTTNLTSVSGGCTRKSVKEFQMCVLVNVSPWIFFIIARSACYVRTHTPKQIAKSVFRVCCSCSCG